MIKMKATTSIFLFVGFIIHLSRGNNQDKLERLIKEIKGESDKVASEIYSWIDQHKKGFETFKKPHGKTRDSSRTNLKENKHDIKYVAKMLKGESDHLADELFSWINKHKTARGHPRDGTRDHSRGHVRNRKQKQMSSQKSSQVLKILHRAVSRGKSRGYLSGKPSRQHTRQRRAVADSGDGLEGESIQDVMMDLMNAPHKETPKLRKHETKKISKAKMKISKPLKSSSVGKFKKSVKKKLKSKKSRKPVKQIKKIKTSKRSNIPKPKVNFAVHPTKSNKVKATGLPDLLKLISADPAKKILVSNVEDNIKFDEKSLKIINDIPKPVLKNLLKNINLEKYIRMSNYLPNIMKDTETKKKGKKVEKSKLKKIANKKMKDAQKSDKSKENKSIKKSVQKVKKITVVKLKKTTKKPATKSFKPKKKANSTKKGNSETSASRSKVKKKSSHAQKEFKGKTRSNVEHARKKLSALKEKIKKTNSLKFKVAKALLEHCETQNKLKRIFDNVNASLKEATRLAKAIGKKYGVKRTEVDRLSTEHTEEAVAEFLDKFF